MPQLRRLVDSPGFTGVIVAVILFNAVVLGLHTYPGIDREYGDTLVLLNALCLAVFVVEMLLRIASYFPRPWNFFREGWNLFDFVASGLRSCPGSRTTRPSCASPGWRGSCGSSTSSPTSAS